MFRRPIAAAVLPVVLPLESRVVFDATYFNLAAGPLQQNWTDVNQITTSDDWSGVPSIIGYRGDRAANNTGADPRTLLDEQTPPVNVSANVIGTDAPTTTSAGGLFEFENPNSTANPVVGYQGSGAADAPYLKLFLNTTGKTSVPVSYTLRDLDTSDTAQQQFVAQYRVGTTGNYTNIPLSYVADASADGATLTTPVGFNLPADALNKPQVEVRIITADATGADAMIGVDDIVVGGAEVNTFNFDPSAYAVNEAAGTVTLTVTRGSTTAASSVGYNTVSGTAVAGSDFTATSGTLNFAVGVASQTIVVPITNDNVAEALEQFTVTLTSPTGGIIGTSPTATITIADNDAVAPTGLLVNEVSANPPGNDVPNEFIELRGTPGQKLFNVYALSVEGDALANAGAITASFDLSSGTIGSNGLLVVRGATSTLTINPATGVVTSTSLDTGTAGVLQNGANSFLIVYSPNAVPSGDIDVNNDGVIDALPAGATLLDGVGYLTTNATAPGIAYGAILPQLTTTAVVDDVPDAVTRLPGNSTPLSAAAFYGGDLEGTENTSVAYITTDATRLTANTPAGAVLTPGAANFGGGGTDTTPPTVDSAAFVFNLLATPMSVTLDFSENVQASLAAGDLVLRNLTTNTTVPTGNITISGYNTTTDVATVTFPGYANGVLPDGRYRLQIAPGSVTDAAGNAVASTYSFDFFALAGDIDRDGGVSINDFNVFASNFGKASGQTFTNGDFDADGGVSINDFNLLAGNFGRVLAAVPPPAEPQAVAAAPAKTARLSGVAFNDANRNGIYDRGDSVAAGKTIWLDLDNDGQRDSNEPSTVTGKDGRYEFKALAAGTYHVRRVVPKGYALSTGVQTVTLTAGQSKAASVIGTKKV